MMDILSEIERAFNEKKLCKESVENLKKWITKPEFKEYREAIEEKVKQNAWEELDDCFYKIIEFGTGGRRGSRGIGPNRINLRTIGESAQGLADYIHEIGSPSKGVVIAYDTRHGSLEFAREVAQILAANNIPAFFYPSPRSTPQLSFSIRYLHTQAGCMISASHNPPSDNGIKVSWADGGQVLPPHDQGIIKRVQKVTRINRIPFDQATRDGKIKLLDKTIDTAYLNCLQSLSLSDSRRAKIAYTPLHGVGNTNVVPLLSSLNFNLVTVQEQMVPDPDFSSVKNRLPNPELPAAMEKVTQLADLSKASVAMASDPDADRLGATVPCPEFVNPSRWLFLTGNQIGILILDHVLRQMTLKNILPEQPVLIKTIVTTEMLDALCKEYNVEVIKDLLVGFKYIAEVTESLPPEKTVIFTTEESHGYNRGTFVRDKDSAPAALHLAELASELAEKNKTIYQHLNDLYRKYGYYSEVTRSIYYPGKSGLETMLSIMSALRKNPPKTIGPYSVHHVIDRTVNEIRDISTGEIIGRIHQHCGNVLTFTFNASGKNRITVRPSGTEPKIKFYSQLWQAVSDTITDEDLETVKTSLNTQANTLIEAISNPGSH
ncbi:phospho-sugar mutase [bacterium]|nr:phospho-sugar mutase [candidate division CSSED10-310 bacterium]